MRASGIEYVGSNRSRARRRAICERAYDDTVRASMEVASGVFSRRRLAGLVLAIIACQQSLTPSLLPRSWVAQGIITGAAMLAFYAVGSVLAGLASLTGLFARVPRERLRQWRVFAGWTAVASVPVLLILSIPGRQGEWRALGYDTGDRFLYVGAVIVAYAVVVLGGLLGWGLRTLYRRVFRGVSRLLPWSIAGLVSLALTVTVVTLAANELAYKRFMDGVNTARADADTELSQEDPRPPTVPVRSGVADSLVGWEELGREGRRFVTRAPSVAELERYSGRPAMDPIRVFVGRAVAPSDAERADIAVRELERTGAFERSTLLLVTPTGTGWVNEQIVQPIEYFTAGDAATVAVQYSHLPSPVAYLSEQEAAVTSATLLTDAVLRRIEELPGDARPRVLVAGESLGAYGGNGAFANLDDLVRRVDGSLWVGAPPMAHLRREAEARRDGGSPQIRPSIARLPEVVAGGRPSEFADTDATHAFLQFADDPIVWWDLRLAIRRPDWLAEPLDPRVKPDVRWRPVTTFLQLTADQIVGTEFGEGWGHRYGSMPLVVWYETLDPVGWDQARLHTLRRHLDEIADSFHGPVA